MDAYQSQYILLGLPRTLACLGRCPLQRVLLRFFSALPDQTLYENGSLFNGAKKLPFIFSQSTCYPFSASDGVSQVLRTLISIT